MPELSRFYGIVIQMYFNDHEPAHFHARYGGGRAVVNIDPPIILHGRLPPRAQSMVVEWAPLHRTELRESWRRMRRREAPDKIAPLE